MARAFVGAISARTVSRAISADAVFAAISPSIALRQFWAVAILMVMLGVTGPAAITEPKVRLPHNRADLARGEKLFQVHCALCHGPKGEGGRGPLLTRAKLSHAPDDATLLKVIED